MRWLIESIEVVFFVWLFVRVLDVINMILGLIFFDVVMVSEVFVGNEGVDEDVDFFEFVFFSSG